MSILDEEQQGDCDVDGLGMGMNDFVIICWKYQIILETNGTEIVMNDVESIETTLANLLNRKTTLIETIEQLGFVDDLLEYLVCLQWKVKKHRYERSRKCNCISRFASITTAWRLSFGQSRYSSLLIYNYYWYCFRCSTIGLSMRATWRYISARCRFDDNARHSSSGKCVYHQSMFLLRFSVFNNRQLPNALEYTLFKSLIQDHNVQTWSPADRYLFFQIVDYLVQTRSDGKRLLIYANYQYRLFRTSVDWRRIYYSIYAHNWGWTWSTLSTARLPTISYNCFIIFDQYVFMNIFYWLKYTFQIHLHLIYSNLWHAIFRSILNRYINLF
jgi:hypothetical protein